MLPMATFKPVKKVIKQLSYWVWAIMPVVALFLMSRSASRVWQDIQRTSSSAAWPSTLGQITHVIDPDLSWSKRYRDDAILAFKYSVNGQEYTGNTISYSRRKKWYYSEIKNFIIPYKGHPRVRLFYDPQQPSVAVLLPGGGNSDNIWFFAGQCFVIVVTSIILILGIWQTRRHIAKHKAQSVKRALRAKERRQSKAV